MNNTYLIARLKEINDKLEEARRCELEGSGYACFCNIEKAQEILREVKTEVYYDKQEVPA